MNEIWAEIIKSAFTFLGVLVTVYFGSRTANKNLTAKVDKLVEHDHDQYLSIQRLTIMNSEMPISERIIAGDKYVKEGGNGDVKKYYQQMLKEHTV